MVARMVSEEFTGSRLGYWHAALIRNLNNARRDRETKDRIWFRVPGSDADRIRNDETAAARWSWPELPKSKQSDGGGPASAGVGVEGPDFDSRPSPEAPILDDGRLLDDLPDPTWVDPSDPEPSDLLRNAKRDVLRQLLAEGLSDDQDALARLLLEDVPPGEAIRRIGKGWDPYRTLWYRKVAPRIKKRLCA